MPNAGVRHVAGPGLARSDRDPRALWRRHAQRRQRLGATKAHPLWAPMDFECKELTEKHQNNEKSDWRASSRPRNRDGSSLPKKSLT